jgi:hypothetical protein
MQLSRFPEGPMQRIANLDAQGLHRYAAFGLNIVSEIPLPELYPVRTDAGADADVRIRLEGPPEVFDSDLFAAEPGRVTLTFPAVGRYRVHDGAEIAVTPHEGASARSVRLFLLGSAFGVLFHQRGLFPLHANAIVADGMAFAFAGPAGIGKSTLAACFQSRGYDVLCDDVCVVSFDAQGRPLAWPGLPRLKLWKDAANIFGYDSDGLERAVDGHDKYHVPLPSVEARGPFPLASIYILGDQKPGADFEAARLAGAAALEAIADNIYRGEYLAPMNLAKSGFEHAARVARHCAVYTVSRRRGYDVFASEVEKLERHFGKIPAAAERRDA